MQHKFQLGQRIKDLVSGITGITTSRIEYLNGCWQYSIRLPYKDGDSKLAESYWFDQDQLVLIDNGILEEKGKTNYRDNRIGGSETIAQDFNQTL